MKNRICFCIESLRIGGAERLLVELINNWNSIHWELYLITFSPQNDFASILTNRIEKHSVFNSKSRLIAISRMRNFCLEHKINVVLTHLERPNKWLSIGAKLAGVKAVINTVHSINIYDSHSRLKKTAIGLYYNLFPSKIIAVSNFVKDYLCKLGIKPAKIHVINNGIDRSYLLKKYQIAPDKKIVKIGFIGRLEKVKGPYLLLDAISRAITIINCKVVFVGGGKELNNLKNYAKQLGISKVVRFLGPDIEPHQHLTDCRCICMPSFREGLPMALLECLSIGLPAIVSDVGMLPSIVKEGNNGFVCQAGSIKSLYDCLISISALSYEQWKIFSTNAIKSTESYDISKCVAQYIRLCSHE